MAQNQTEIGYDSRSSKYKEFCIQDDLKETNNKAGYRAYGWAGAVIEIREGH